jgi:hypothetical protein
VGFDEREIKNQPTFSQLRYSNRASSQKFQAHVVKIGRLLRICLLVEDLMMKGKMVAPGGFEPPSAGPEPAMLGRYTTELFYGIHRLARELRVAFFIFSVMSVDSDTLFISARE